LSQEEKAMKQPKTRQLQHDMFRLVETLRTVTPDVLAAALKVVRGDDDGKRRKKQSRFHGADHYLTREEFKALCEASTPFYRLLWKLMLAHCLRISEAIHLRPDNLQNGYLCVQRLKGSEYTRQPLLVDLSSRLQTGSYRIFPCHRSSAFLHFRRAAKEVGIDRDRQHPHCIRHSGAVMLLSAGVPLNLVSRYLGHRSLQSTAVYLNASDLSASTAAAPVMRGLIEGGAGSAIKPPMVPDAAAIAQVIGVL
jgi:integrase